MPRRQMIPGWSISLSFDGREKATYSPEELSLNVLLGSDAGLRIE